MSSLISVNYVVRNGGKYIHYFLNSIKNQTYRDFEVHVLDNNSDDDTREIIRQKYPEFNLHESSENIGAWAGFEKLLGNSTSKYIICMTDVILKENFLEKAVVILENNPDCGALQAKVYQMELYKNPEFAAYDLQFTENKIIDTCGFKIFKSRKIINLGHGEKDKGQFNNTSEIFAVEGVVPIFRREALEDCKIEGWLIDPHYRVGAFGYGDDLDLSWRMRLLGWKQMFAPNVIAYHDRSTTKGYSKSLKNYFQRIKERSKINITKRRLDWRNNRFTIIKNDYIINILKDLPHILLREIGVLGYTILFEPMVLAEFPNFIKYLPRMFKRRKIIMKRSKISSQEIRKWFE